MLIHCVIRLQNTKQQPTRRKRHSSAAAHANAKKPQNAKKTGGFGPLFEGQMSKNGTPLWREAHLSVKMYKTPAFCNILRGFSQID